MRGGVFGEGQCSGPPPHQIGGLGENVTTLPHPSPPRKSPRICTNPVVMLVDGRGRVPPVPPRGYATAPLKSIDVGSINCLLMQLIPSINYSIREKILTY